jgi:hypothetical protein
MIFPERANPSYRLASGGSRETLEAEVAELLHEGYRPCGGVSVAVLHMTWEDTRKGFQESETDWVYTQAMFKT